MVTGGAGGIGSAFARRAASWGATLVIVDLDEVRAKALVGDLPSANAGHLSIRADLTDQQQIEAVMERVGEHCGRIDVLVNNTGMTSTERFGDRSLAVDGARDPGQHPVAAVRHPAGAAAAPAAPPTRG